MPRRIPLHTISRTLAALAVSILVGMAASLGPATAAPARSADPPGARAAARSALAEARSALAPGPAEAGVSAVEGARPDASWKLARLARSVPYLSRGGRRSARRLLDRPSMGGGSRRTCEDRFCVHWKKRGKDAPAGTDADSDGVPDFVQRVLRIARHCAAVENGRLGWRRPRSDGGRGGGSGMTDIYIKRMPSGLFGYAVPDMRRPNRHRSDGRVRRSFPGHLVLDRSFSARRYGGVKSSTSLRVTMAHEYNHILQFGYDVYQDSWMAESTATWMERIVYPTLHDYLRYIGRWSKLSQKPLTSSGYKAYGTAVWNQWLAAAYGDDVIRDAWAGAADSRPPGLSTATYARAIARAGGRIADDLIAFAGATAEWRTGGAFPDGGLFPDMARKRRLGLGSEAEGRLDHAGFDLFGIDPGTAGSVVVKVRFGSEIPSGLALVARAGSPTAGQVTEMVAAARHGRATIRLPDPARFTRITAVPVNAETGMKGRVAAGGAWIYRGNHVPFRIKVRPGPVNPG